MVDSIIDDTQTPVKTPSLSSSAWATPQLSEFQQLTPCSQTTDNLNTPTHDEYTRWILTASQKKLQRESKIQRQAPTNRQTNIDSTISTVTAEDDLTMNGHFSDDDDDDDDDDSGDDGDSNDFDMDINKDTTKTQDDKGTRIRQKSMQLDLKSALDSYGQHCDQNESSISNNEAARNRKNQIRRRHTSLPATTPTRLPTSKTSSIHQQRQPQVLPSGRTLSPSRSSSASRAIYGSSLSQHKQQQLAATTWLDYDPYDTNVISITSRQQEQQTKRRPISMLSASFDSRSSYLGTCDTLPLQGKTDKRLVNLETYLSRSPLKCIDKDKDMPEVTYQYGKSPKTPSNQNTITTRIPLPINKKAGSTSSKQTPLEHNDIPSLEPTCEPHKRQPGIGGGTELRRRPSLMSSDTLKAQQKQLQQHLDINLVSVQGELSVPAGILQQGVVYRQQQQQQQSHHPPPPSTTLPRTRPLPRRVSSLHERLQQLAHDDSAWNEITKKSTVEKRKGTGLAHGNRKNGIPIPPSLHSTTGTSPIIKHLHTPPDQQSPSKPHDASAPTTRPAMSPPTAYKLYKPLLSPFEQQEILSYPQIYFVGNHAKNKYHATMDRRHGNYGYDDGRGDYVMVPRDHLAYRYEMLQIMGKGSFGQVIKAFDHKLGSTVAVKIIRNRKRFHAQALVEVKTLEDLLKWDPDDKHNNVRMTDHFYFRNHLCIAFECLDINLYDFIKGNNFQGFSMGLIRRFTIQLLNSLVLLHQHHLIHCDLKPENVLLKDPTKSTIKVIDFGSSCLENEKVYTYIQSRFYRAPEVILGLDYGVEIDMWSVGCILAELYTGSPLFPGENEQDQLARIMEIQGVPALSIVEKCTRRKFFFDAYGNPKITMNTKGKKRRPDTKSLADVLKCSDTKFVDFIDRCLQWNPADRIKSEEAFKHGWIARQQPKSPQT